MFEKLFKLKENNTNVKTEVLAGITTFMTMAYILAVNPSIQAAAGMDQGAVFTATAVSAFLGTLLMACTGNGTECVFCIHSSNWYGIHMAGCTGGSFCGRSDFYSAFNHKCA